MRPSRSRLVVRAVTLLAVALVASAFGVAVVRRRRRATRFEDAAARLALQARAMDLPRSEVARLPAVVPSLRVLVSPAGVDVDHAAVMATWRPEERAAVLVSLEEAWADAMPLGWRGLVPIARGTIAPEHRRGGAQGLLLPRMAERLADVRRVERLRAQGSNEMMPEVVTVYADARVTCDALIPVLYTLGQGSYGTYHFVERTPAGDGAVVVIAPRYGERADALGLTVVMLAGGYGVRTERGFVQPGCRALGAEVMTVPDVDATALTRCAQAIRATWPDEARGAHRVLLSVRGASSYGSMLRALDALRESEPGACEADPDAPGCLFPDAVLGVRR